MTVALITGITGQDGSYLARFLLQKGYEVHGMVRRSSVSTLERIADLTDEITLHQGDLLDQTSLIRLLEAVDPHEVYNLAAQSFVPTSFEQPVLTSEVTGLGTLRMLEAIRRVNIHIRFYQASTSEIFGKVSEEPQNEQTPFHPRSPYGVAKTFAHYTTQSYRESYGLFACNGILFNHESPLRGLEFVTRKIARGAARIRCDLDTVLELGCLSAERDWGYAGDYVKAMWLMLQQDWPDDFVIATGVKHSVREFVSEAFRCVGLPSHPHLHSNTSLLRPADVYTLKGDPSKAASVLGWVPEVSFHQLVAKMVEAEMYRAKNPHQNTLPRDLL